MRIANKIWTRSGADTVPYASVITKIGTIGDRKWETTLSDGDARDLPAAQQRMSQSGAFKERQTVDIANGKVVTQVEIGAGTIGSDVIGVEESCIAAIGRVVDRVAVGV